VSKYVDKSVGTRLITSLEGWRFIS